MTIKKLKTCDISGFKLVLPTVSTGNVAQLSADLFIESLKMEKYAVIWNSAIIPILGPSAFETKTRAITTASEMFISEKEKLLILQTRTPLTAALLSGYIEEIVKFFKDEKLSDLIILTSSFSHEMHVVDKNPFEFISSVEGKTFSGFSEASTEFKVPGCGYAMILFKQAKESGINAVVFFKYVSEGDNFFCSIQLCEKVNETLKIIPIVSNKPEIKIPISWKFLFGRNVNVEIY